MESLKEDDNVIIIHPVPRGPELNLLDLGVWMSLQSFVEKQHRGNMTDNKALARTCEESWDKFDSTVFRNVYTQWQKVLQLVIDDKGGSKLVEKRKKEFISPIILPEDYSPLPEDSDGEAGNEDGGEEEEVEGDVEDCDD